MAEQVQVAVTGASGYIARYVIAELLDAGHAVRGTLRDMGRADDPRPTKVVVGANWSTATMP
ncbi:MAG: NmrA family NAD(P)-binding protein, partial [Alphaproteobacteria bacterium]|nr:NmrA family NAD(P)-binding protein [Alphaproteobacteria bacterium]